ncbi:MAG TPA: PQQ-binding-like beta-propeller repeat protein, partial [Candidatus Eisenbacteria bacterium]|nr:PQQ-binding-like beta-propeller repeat protein [Candidatus Eisenbacteria bacterium]
TIYFGSSDQNLYALNPDGSTRWVFATEGGVVSSPAIGADGVIYVGSYDHNLYAVNPDGTRRWKFLTDGYVISSPVIGIDGTIYLGSYDHNLYALNPDGTERWRFTSASVILATPALAADGTIYLALEDGSLRALDSAGSNQWTFSTGRVIHSSPVIGRDGTIYFGAANRIYAVEGSAPPANSPWPMYHQNPRHTGRVAVSPRLAAPRISSSSGLEFDFTGELSANYRIEASTNLIHWTVQTNFILERTASRWCDSGARELPLRFYRMVSP